MGEVADHIIPCGHYAFHIQVTGKESDDTVWDNFAVLNEYAAEVTYDGWIVPDFKARADRYLITSSGDDLNSDIGTSKLTFKTPHTHQGQEGITRQRHGI